MALCASALAAAQPAQTPLSLNDAFSGGRPSVQALRDSFYQASVRASRAAQHDVEFETGTDATTLTAPSFDEAATVTSRVLVDMAGGPTGKAALARIADVVITAGLAPSARFSGGVLTITIAPLQGVSAGRPSADEIERTAMTPAAAIAARFEPRARPGAAAPSQALPR